MLREEHFLRNTRAIKKALALNAEEYRELFGMGQKEAEVYLLNPQSFPLQYAYSFCENLNLDLVSMFSKTFDVQAFSRSHYSKEIVFPETYLKEKNSKMVTINNIIQTLENNQLEWLIELIFKRLQIPHQVVHFPKLEISNKLTFDFITLVHRFTKNLELLQEAGRIGVFSLDKNCQLSLGHTEQSFQARPVDYFEDFFENRIRSFDASCDYSISRVSGQTVEVICSPNERLRDLYDGEILWSDATNTYKEGIAASLTGLLGLKNSQAKTQLQEDGSTLITIEYSRPHHQVSELLH
jgi:hypothetical protein